MREERELLAGRIDLPRFATDFRDRSALVVVRGVGHQRDLRALRPFIRDMRPVLVAVDGGAEALLQAGLCPDMIVGDMDSAGEAALLLRGGAELVVHSYPDGRAPGRERLDELGVPYKVVPAPGTSQDVAMLLAAEKGARLIVAVGSQFNLVEFLDRNREGMSSTFLTRLRIGEILVDAKGVSRLYRPRPGPDSAAGRDRRGPDRDGRRRGDDAGVAGRRRTAVAEAAAAARRRLTWRLSCKSPEDVRLPLPRAVPRGRAAGAGGGHADRGGDRRLEPRLLGEERHRRQPQLGSQRRAQAGGAAAGPARRGGSVRERAVSARGPRPAERAQRRAGVPGRLLQHDRRAGALGGHAGRGQPDDRDHGARAPGPAGHRPARRRAPTTRRWPASPRWSSASANSPDGSSSAAGSWSIASCSAACGAAC